MLACISTWISTLVFYGTEAFYNYLLPKLYSWKSELFLSHYELKYVKWKSLLCPILKDYFSSRTAFVPTAAQSDFASEEKKNWAFVTRRCKLTHMSNPIFDYNCSLALHYQLQFFPTQYSVLLVSKVVTGYLISFMKKLMRGNICSNSLACFQALGLRSSK